MDGLLQCGEAKETATLLAYLASMMNYPPDEAFVENMRESYKNDPSGNADMEQFWQKHKDNANSEIVLDIAAEWARLFRGVLSANVQQPPYAGIFIAKDGLGTDIMVALKFMYDSHGFTPAKQDRMDYLGIILDFAAGLLGNYALFVEKEQMDEANSCLETLKELNARYITTWVERFVNQSLKNTQNPLYREYMFTLLETINGISDVLKQEEQPC